MITVLVGQCCSGKDSVARELIKNYSYKRVVSNTTRPMRSGEKEGVDYYFHDRVPDMKESDVVSFKRYASAQGEWCYWFNRTDIENAVKSDDNYIVIADVDGAKILEEYGAKILYVYAAWNIRAERYFRRESKNKAPDYKEALRRLIADQKAFEEFEKEVFKQKYKCLDNNDLPLPLLVEWANDLIKEIQ